MSEGAPHSHAVSLTNRNDDTPHSEGRSVTLTTGATWTPEAAEAAEAAEKQLDAFIAHRSRQNGEGEREREEAWKASARRYNARLREEIRAEWCEYHRQQAARHRRTLQALISRHETLAASLQTTERKEPA